MPPTDVASGSGPPGLPPGVALRRATGADGDELADLFISVRRENLGAIPALIHGAESVRTWMSTVVLPRDEVWVASQGDSLIGFLALGQPDWIEHLYLARSATGQGIGTALVEVAERELGPRLQLWTFQSNAGARRFYERLGFVAVEQTDGDNEEGEPDVRYVRDRRDPPARSVGPRRQSTTS